MSVTPPFAKKIPHTFSHHQDTRHDHYHWLRDDERSNAEVLAHLEQENAYTEQVLAPQSTLQHTLYQEMTARLRPDDSSVPYLKNGYCYQSRYQEGLEYALFERYPEGKPEQVALLLDGNARAQGADYYELAQVAISPDQQLLAFAEDFISRRHYQIRIKSLQTGALFEEVLENTSGNLVWANDNKTLFYVYQDQDTLWPYRVYRHTLGTAQSQDVLVYEETDMSFYTSLYKSRSQDYIIIGGWSTLSSEINLLSANFPHQATQLFLAREREHEYEVEHFQDTFYIRSNKDGANFGLYETPTLTTVPSQWHTKIAPRSEVLLEGFTLFNDWLVVEERSQGLTQLRQLQLEGAIEYTLRFDDPTYVTWLDINADPHSVWLRYGYSSMTQPVTLYEINLHTQERRELKRDYAGEQFKASHYCSERLWVSARDGVKVPVSVVYRADLFNKAANQSAAKGANPLLIYGYGAYGASMDSDFSAARLSLLDRGFVYAIAHVRGGEELGRDWYEQGRLLSKLNSFNDFIDVTQALTAQGYGDKNRVYANGASAGGLLVAGVLNMAPQLYHGAVVAVPFVDVVSTMLDETIPLTTGEFDEWGNPAQATFYHYIKSYSPYDQVQPQAYPHLLVTTGLHDSQVQYWEPAKWVAKLRELKTDNHLLLLHCDMTTGHGGKSGRFEAYHELARDYAFLLTLAASA
ncbi:S9 family peptidase [Oceanisphaera avium]|uniref:Oligopeptidase B n=1 Tax=Oceanisphaera avium TaxID=1903694 RepID=A0A1Y0D0A6_9GAMM|nr:S9 family peptidase [Oceanisphaera avium]ART80567.1 oligopeptidase B [Oceanisphaera avium]